MFKCVYNADMTEQQINMQKKEARRVPCERHLGLIEPITTKDFIWLKAFSQCFKNTNNKLQGYIQ